MEAAYKDFIQYSLNKDKSLPDSFNLIKWHDFMQFCYQQSILGVVFDGLNRANKRIPQEVLFEWISYIETIKQQNQVVINRLISVTKWFEEKGYRTIILKGQVNGLMYPKPELRSPGDIDIWVDAPKMDIIRLVQKVCSGAEYSIHHIKMPVFNDVSVEVHYRPIYLTNWIKDKKLQRYIEKIKEDQFSESRNIDGIKIGCLTDEFNVVYQLLHMYAHFFSTRNNFKQFIDYYYLLKHTVGKYNKNEILNLLKKWGVLPYAKGIMWVMNTTLGLEKNYLYIENDERIGKLILEESMKFGTFSRNKFVQVCQQFIGNMRLVRFFPSEAIISPLFLVWHQWWKVKMKWRLALV